MSKKSLLANVLFGVLRFASLPISGAVRPKGLPVLAYHRICALPGPDYPFSGGTISASPEEFDIQMRFVSKHFSVINFNILYGLLSGGSALPENPLIITFDDGYSDNYTIALDILLKYNLTAAVFLSTSFIDSGEPFWHDKCHYLLRRTGEKIIDLDSGRYVIKIDGDDRGRAIQQVSRIFASVPDRDRVRLFGQLEEQSKVRVPSEDLKMAKPLTWHQIKEMSMAGMEFGSHTVGHPFLANMTGDEMRHELVTSKEVIEKETGVEVKSIAYPSGNYNKAVVESVKQAGYRFGIAYEHGIWDPDRAGPYAIPRIHVEADTIFPLFQASLFFPQVFVR